MASIDTLPSPARTYSANGIPNTAAAAAAPATHIVLLPFMSKGHTIPLLHLANLLVRRGIIVTIITTPENSPFILLSLTNTSAAVLELPFPGNAPDLPAGIESTDKLPSMDLFLPFIHATKLLQPLFEKSLQALPPPISCIIYDGFLGWAQLSATKLNIPGLLFYGMNTFVMTISGLVLQHRPHKNVQSDDEIFSLPSFPWLKLRKRDLNEPFKDPELKGPLFDFIMESRRLTAGSRGIVVNSFYELEPVYVDFFNREFGFGAWCVGPLCMASPRIVDSDSSKKKIKWAQWLDDRRAMQRPVLYVAFGTQAEMSTAQLRELGIGLERSGVGFLWVLRSKEADLGDGFEERVAERGLIVRDWVEQKEVLGKESVKGFLSHCGWNSVLESICAKVPILAWPMMADQNLNAKMVVDEIRIGLRIPEGDGVVGWEVVAKMVRDLMVGERGKEVEKKVKEVGEAAEKAMAEGGSSCRSLDMLIEEVRSRGKTTKAKVREL